MTDEGKYQNGYYTRESAINNNVDKLLSKAKAINKLRIDPSDENNKIFLNKTQLTSKAFPKILVKQYCTEAEWDDVQESL